MRREQSTRFLDPLQGQIEGPKMTEILQLDMSYYKDSICKF